MYKRPDGLLPFFLFFIFFLSFFHLLKWVDKLTHINVSIHIF